MISILTWNIRGLNIPFKQSEIRNLISDKRLDIVSIIETKISPTNITVVDSRIAAHWPLIHNYSFTQLCRIWVMWNPNAIDPNVITTTRQSIHCYITIIGQHINFYTSFVYASNSTMERLSLWDDIISHSTLVFNNLWILMVDFNIISNTGEKNGGSTRGCPAINDVCECLQQAKLEDLKFTGILFTWNNRSLGNACIAKKLDRALINYHWNATLPSSEYTFLPPGVSDQSPILVTINSNSPKKCLPFRFFNAWCTHPQFLPSVQCALSYYIAGTAMFQVVQRLKKLKHILKSKCRNDFSEVASKIQAVKWELDKCQLDLDHNPSDIQLRLLDLFLTKEYMRLAGIQEIMLRQKIQNGLAQTW
ncbi:uncharacterized protein LOC132272850 [Cornus florida]|uniref:uncharacterized protein LOC132272850 n=1 Tax=Cornus florida TaxID=4283 RepID=UPI0028A18928|nr:uncharacterized protein LOC132272850 [Cornus florida]